MLINKTGDILKATENIICHQVNVDGVMGGGLAKQIASIYPNVEKEYKKLCDMKNNDYESLKWLMKFVSINNTQYIANCFTQKPNFDTDYDAIKQCFEFILTICKEFHKSIAVPCNYGCGIANGDWNIVENIFKELSEKEQVDITIYEYNKEEI